MSKTAFIGHRQVFAENIWTKLLDAITNEITNGCSVFTMGTHGDFDKLSLSACRELRDIYHSIKIEVVITSLNSIKYNADKEIAPYSDVDTVMYDIENTHYKQQISSSNRQMLDTCDTLICYVDENKLGRSGAKNAMKYAKKIGLKVINLYRKEDQPYYGMTMEEIKNDFNSRYDRIIQKNKRK